MTGAGQALRLVVVVYASGFHVEVRWVARFDAFVAPLRL